jgi:hypothetical protein
MVGNLFFLASDEQGNVEQDVVDSVLHFAYLFRFFLYTLYTQICYLSILFYVKQILISLQ